MSHIDNGQWPRMGENRFNIKGNRNLGCPNTGYVSVPFPPLLTGVWVRIIVLFQWAAIGETPGQFFKGEVPNCVIKYFKYLEYDNCL